MSARGSPVVGGATRGRGIRPRRVAVVTAAFYAPVVITLVVGLAWPLVAPVRMLVIAHHGDVTAWPADSLPAISAAAQSGADGIEFDVDRSAEGTWWVLHSRDLEARTSGSGSSRTQSDAQMAALRIDGGAGYDPTRHAGLLAVPRLSEVLDSLAGYTGTVIVDCKDDRPGAHAALAGYLASRGLFPWIIAHSARGAAEIKGVDHRFWVLTQIPQTDHPEVDGWLASATYQVVPPRTTWADLFGGLGMFVEESYVGDERPLLDNGRRWGVSFVISNDVRAALAWRDAQVP